MNDNLLVELVTKAIRDINSEPALTQEEKAFAIKKLGGMPRQVLYDYLNINYRSGPDLMGFVRNYVSEGRPSGGPSTTKAGTTLKTIRDKLKTLNKRKKT